MSEYRYVVFPSARQPTFDEVRHLQAFAGALANHFAWGSCREDGRLAVAFDARGFDHVKASDAGFAALLKKWGQQGCEIVEQLRFVKAAAVRPVNAVRAPGAAAAARAASQQDADELAPSEEMRDAIHDANKEFLSREVEALAALNFDNTMRRMAVLQRFGAWGLYLFMGLGVVFFLGAGLFVRSRLLDPSHEQHRVSTQRAAEDQVKKASEDPGAK